DAMATRYVVEHLNHLGMVAEVCREIGVAAWLDQQEPGNRQRVSVGTATVALVLNGLGFSNRQLYLVPQFFADKPVEHLLGPVITADALNDDACTIQPTSVPLASCLANRSASTCCTRPSGRWCCSTRETARARTRGPYCARLGTTAGNAPTLICWQGGQRTG